MKKELLLSSITRVQLEAQRLLKKFAQGSQQKEEPWFKPRQFESGGHGFMMPVVHHNGQKQISKGIKANPYKMHFPILKH